MKIRSTIVWVNCGLFAAFGLAFTLAPVWLASFATGAAPVTPSAVIDMRATYGGMALGLAMLFGLCAHQASTVRLGLQGVLAVMACLAGARTLGMVVDGSPNAFMLALLGAELVMAVLAAFALHQGDAEEAYNNGLEPTR